MRALLLSFVACATTPSSPTAPPPTLDAPIAAAPAEPAPAPEPKPAPAPEPEPAPAPEPKPVEPKPTTCTIEHRTWSSTIPRTLRTASGRAYATFDAADLLTITTADGPRITYEGLGLRLHATPRPGDLPVHVRSELLFDDTLQAGRGTPLLWSAIDGPRLRLTPPEDRRVRLVKDPARDVDCSALALVPGIGDLVEPDRLLRPRGPVAVAAIAGGPVVLRLHLPRPVDVKELERAGSQARIAWPILDGPLFDATVIGWIDARLIHPSVARGGEFTAGGLGLEGGSHWAGCTSDRPIHVDAGRGPEHVGTILAGTRVEPGKTRGKLVVVDVLGPSVRSKPPPIRLRPGVRFLLDPADAADCSR